MIASLGYLDTFAKIDRAWFFAERNVIVHWSETRSMRGARWARSRCRREIVCLLG
jgi:hypothetical protein